MWSRVIPAMILLVWTAGVSASAGPYYARGTFYAGTGEIWGFDSGNELFDDGLHGDEAAGDGIYGGFVIPNQEIGFHEWKIGTADWSENFPLNPIYPMANAVLYLLNSGEAIHFRLDTNTLADGWQPASNAVACSHFDIPWPGYDFELIGSPPELGEWLSGIPVVMGEFLWIANATIAEPGHHEFKFRVIDSWDFCNLGIHYNMFRGENFTFETTEPQTTVRFEFNVVDGRARAVQQGPVGTDNLTWGQVKGLFR